NVRVEDCGDQGIETYSIDGVVMDSIVVKNCTSCGVLFNLTKNAKVGTINAYNCAWGTGYAGLRYANECTNITTDKLIADHCGRGFFIVKSGPSVNCHVNYAEIYECSDMGIWIENGTNCSVKAGCCESPISVSGSGSSVKVSRDCGSVGVTCSRFSYHPLNQNDDYSVYSIDGKLIPTIRGIQFKTNDTHLSLPSGVYFIKNRSSSDSRKIVIGSYR
ncbi:MAG: T9SS type A sorting domain-containing protein, partial [Chitinispirillaceae bacterium]|nr:T9SS type A sorting domain-containing protein [Chitinispirillaceae bacterium]